MNEMYATINGLTIPGGIIAITALFYALLPAETANVLRGITELLGITKEETK